MNKLDGLTGALGIFEGAFEHGHGEIEADHVESGFGEFDGVMAVAAAEIENACFFLKTEVMTNEFGFADGLTTRILRNGAEEVFIKDLGVPFVVVEFECSEITGFVVLSTGKEVIECIDGDVVI